MDIRQLEYFVAVAEQLHFSRAAESLYISQSSLSYHMSELEKELGVTLFLRSRRSVFLTPVGSILLPIARGVINGAEEIMRLAKTSRITEAEVSELRICLDATNDRFDLVGVSDAIKRFQQSNPQIELSFSHLLFDEMLHSTVSCQADISFCMLMHGEHVGEILNTFPVYEDNLALVSIHEGTVSDIPDILSRLDLYLSDPEDRWNNQLLKILAKVNANPRIRHLSNVNNIMSMVELGSGAMILPRSHIDFEAASRPWLKAIEFDLPEASSNMYALWSKDNINPAIQQLLNCFSAD